MYYLILSTLLAVPCEAQANYDADAAAALVFATAHQAPMPPQAPPVASACPCEGCDCGGKCGCVETGKCLCAERAKAKADGWLWTDEGGGYYYKWVPKAQPAPVQYAPQYQPQYVPQYQPQLQAAPAFQSFGGFGGGSRGGC